MPSAAARRLYEDQIPTFMSVFDLGSEALDGQAPLTVVDPKILGFAGSSLDVKLASGSHPANSLQQQRQQQQLPARDAATAAPSSILCDPSHRHHDSTSTQMSESADSSPTTTMSCTDSSSLSDPSPSSSPDSPVNLLPLHAFPGPSFGGLSGMAPLSPPPAAATATTQERPMTSPSPRRRNMKGLSIQPPFASPTLSSTLMSEPSSPSFIKPQIPAMKRKPSQLSLKTSTHDLTKPLSLEIPQSPSVAVAPILQRRALKHSTSSPHMLSALKSATFGPAGGMVIPTVLERNESGLSEFLRPSRRPSASSTGFDAAILEENSPIKTQIANRAAFEFEPYHEHENNEDQKTPGYPDGPIAIYGDNVFLYLEPTAEEASRFDVVINVAREVRNPFKGDVKQALSRSRSEHEKEQAKMATRASSVPLGAKSESSKGDLHQQQKQRQQQQSPSDLPSIVEEESHATIAEVLALPAPLLSLSVPPSESAVHDDSTPTTPKASQPIQEPEYIHIPWDHNTDIGADLMMLCETIEKKTQDGKKVLIHCQQGASRSASLIIAYGLYQNPDLTVNDAYYAAQAKSRWISPNMRLMYCLQDFQKEVAKRRASPSSSGLRPRSGRRSPTKHRTALSVDAIDIPPKEPLSAPLPSEDGSSISGDGLGSAKALLSPERSPMRPRGNSTPNSREAISPGPSSAPSSLSWSDKEDEADPQRFGRFPFHIPTIAKPPPSPGKAPQAPRPLNLGLGGGSNALGSGPTLAPPGGSSGTLGSFGSLGRPPPSPGFGAHRFGEFPRAKTSGGESSRRKTPGVSLANFPLLSPRFPPAGFGSDDGQPKSFEDLMFGPPRAVEEEEPQAPAPALAPLAPAADAVSDESATVSKAIPLRPSFPVEEALMSPRVETMTNNPLHDPFAEMAGMRFVEVPPTPQSDELFSPRQTMFPRNPFSPFGRPTQVADPRSPPTKGETPIVRSIDDLI